jgi:hypothetical protein
VNELDCPLLRCMLLKDGTRRYKHLKHMANCTVEREAKEREAKGSSLSETSTFEAETST